MVYTLSDGTQMTRRKRIVVTGQLSGAQTDYQLKLAATYAAAMQSGFDDLRFTQSDMQTLIDAWIESKVDDTSADIWAEFPTTPVNGVTQYYWMYYGNVGAPSGWDGAGTFPSLFDTFDYERFLASRVAGASLGFNAALPRVVVTDNGNWIMVYRAKVDGSAAAGHEGQVWIRTSTDAGETWSAGTKLSSDAYDAINATPIKYPNGDIDIFYTKYDNSATTYHTPNMVSRSGDDGATWGAFTTAPSPLNTDYQIVWQAITIGTDVYLSAHDRIISSGDHNTNLYKTTDNGSTWSKISSITTQVVDGGYGEGGLVYLGSGEFVAVVRATDGQGVTIQKRSTDFGASWSLDGYIKNDGSVAASGVGIDRVLHQNRIWNADVIGNQLGYIAMLSNIYPGSYPRDMYLYFSTDDCASWCSRSAIYTASDCHDSEIVFKSDSSAKYYPGKIAGESSTTEDDVTISPTSSVPTGWTTRAGTVVVSGGELVLNSAAISRAVSFPPDYSIRMRGKYNIANNAARFALFDNTWDENTHTGPYIGWRVGDIMSYDDAWHDGGDYSSMTYDIVEMVNVDDASHTFDLAVNDVVGVSGSGYRNDYDMTTVGLFETTSGGFSIDWIFARKYAANPPTAALGTEEHQRRTPMMM